MKHKGIQPGLEWAVEFYTGSLTEFEVTRATIIDAGNIRVWFKRKSDGQVSSNIYPFQKDDADRFKDMVRIRGTKPVVVEEMSDAEPQVTRINGKAYTEIKV